MIFKIAYPMSNITVLAGGTGSIKLVRALYRLTRDISIVCNIGDNIWLHGLYICPDIDTVVYGLANMLDTNKGWGVKGDTFNCLEQLRLLGEDHWFALGDKDLALHIVRSRMVREGKSLSEVTKHICYKLGICADVIPASNDMLETRILTEQGEMHLQEFWVKHKALPEVKGIVYKGDAKACVEALKAIDSSDKVIIAPANPVSSIGAILAVKYMREVLNANRGKCVAVSPIVGDSPVSGPASKYMRALGYDVNVFSIAKMYNDVISVIVIDKEDVKYKDAIEALGIKVYATDILMHDEDSELRLARFLLSV